MRAYQKAARWTIEATYRQGEVHGQSANPSPRRGGGYNDGDGDGDREPGGDDERHEREPFDDPS
jgi:hypothetical protein